MLLLWWVVSVLFQLIQLTFLQARFLLNSQTSWSVTDGTYSGPEFFRKLIDLFDEDDEWTIETLAWWNK